MCSRESVESLALNLFSDSIKAGFAFYIPLFNQALDTFLFLF